MKTKVKKQPPPPKKKQNKKNPSCKFGSSGKKQHKDEG